jgi:hypothetical protein
MGNGKFTRPNENSITSMKILPSFKHFLVTTNSNLKFIHPNENLTFLYTPEKIPRDNTAQPNESSTKQILFSTSK